MHRTADLHAALSFVIRRVEEQAKLSGEPLEEEQRFLLKNLTHSRSMSVWGAHSQRLVPRNINYERLCALGKAARLNDLQSNPASLDWEFAFAVFPLNHHPMWGLLQQAGVKYRKPLWDRLLLIIGALLPVVVAMTLGSLAGDQPWTLFEWAGILSGSAITFLLPYLASQRMEKWQLQKNIERCRLASRFANTTASYPS